MANVGDLITDGTVTWKVKNIRSLATTTEAGLMSAEDKQKLNDMGTGPVDSANLPVAGTDSSHKGVVFIPSNKGLALNSSGQVSLAAATASNLGGVKSGTDVSVDSNGVLQLSPTVLGGLMSAADRQKLNDMGTGTADVTDLPVAGTDSSHKGVVFIPSNKGLALNSSGQVSLAAATSSNLGGVKIGTGLTIDPTSAVLTISDIVLNSVTSDENGSIWYSM